MANTANPLTVLVEEVFAVTRELEDASLTDRQRAKLSMLTAHAAELERRRVYADAVLRNGHTTYTDRLARELGFRKAS